MSHDPGGAVASRRVAVPKRMSVAARANLDGYLFILPWLLGLVALQIGPMLASMYLSLTHYEVLTPPVFIALDNYKRLFTDDPLFVKSLLKTLYYVAGSVPVRLGVALVLALLLNQPLPGSYLFRVLFYLPSVTSGVAVATVWLWMFEPTYGVINNVLKWFHIPGPPWLGSIDWAMPSIIVMSFIYIGSMMVVFLAGLQGIPRHLYEAAEIDGASGWRRFLNITLPMLSSTIFFNLIMTVITSFQVFTNVYVMTRGGPANATYVYMVYLYDQAFRYVHMGYACALAWVLFVIILIVTLIQVKTSGWVYYEGGH
ncbi:MAG: carbohydrate ABC transporter permease [Anaerolineae bacterium]|jgi:multiple sugar transport system permease protein